MRMADSQGNKIATAIGLAAAAAIAGYALWWRPRAELRVTEWKLQPYQWQGRAPLRLVGVAGLRLGAPDLSPAKLARIVRIVNGLGADVLVLLGDIAAPFLDHDPRLLVAELRNLTAAEGRFAVPGTPQPQDVLNRRLLGEVGIAVLDDVSVKLRGGQGGFWLAGATSGGADELETAMRYIHDDDPIILIAQRAAHFTGLYESDNDIVLQMSGGRGSILDRDEDFYEGRHDEDGRTLIISGAEDRQGASQRVEITVIDLASP